MSNTFRLARRTQFPLFLLIVSCLVLGGPARAQKKVASVEELRAILRDPDKAPSTKNEALTRLGLQGKKGAAAVNDIASLLGSKNHNSACSALGSIGGTEAVGILIRVIQDHPEANRLYAIRALEKIGPDAIDAREPLLKMALGPTATSFARNNQSASISALCAIVPGQPRHGVPILTQMLQERKSARILTGWDSHGHRVIRALGSMGAAAKPAVPLLMELAEKERGIYLTTYIEALGNIGAEAREALPLLRGFLNHKSVFVARAAEKAIGKIK